MRDKNNGGLGLRANANEFGLHAFSRHFVESAERLIHEQQARLFGERPRNGHSLLHPARKLVGIPVGEVSETHHVEEFFHAGIATGDSVKFERECDVVRDRTPRQQAGLLEGNPIVLIEPRLPRAFAKNLDGTGGCTVEVGNEPHESGLAAARRPDKGDELPCGDGQVDTGQGVHLTTLSLKSFVDPRNFYCDHTHAVTSTRR